MTYKHAQQFADRIACMNRQELIVLLRGLHCPFDLDFTDQFLQEAGIDRLRHIVMGAVLHAETVSTGCDRDSLQ